MQFNTDLIIINYERSFNRPEFGLLESRVSILKNFYEKINPRFPLNLKDIEALPGTSLENIGIKITLFNGNCICEVSADKIGIRFTNVKREEDLQIVGDFILLCEDAFFSIFSNTIMKNTSIKTSSWLTCLDGEKVMDNLKEFSSSHKIDPKEFGAENFGDPVLRSNLINNDEGWRVSFNLEKSQVPPTNLFYMCDSIYLENGKYRSFEDRRDHTQKMYLKFLSHLGLEPVEQKT